MTVRAQPGVGHLDITERLGRNGCELALALIGQLATPGEAHLPQVQHVLHLTLRQIGSSLQTMKQCVKDDHQQHLHGVNIRRKKACQHRSLFADCCSISSENLRRSASCQDPPHPPPGLPWHLPRHLTTIWLDILAALPSKGGGGGGGGGGRCAGRRGGSDKGTHGGMVVMSNNRQAVIQHQFTSNARLSQLFPKSLIGTV